MNIFNFALLKMVLFWPNTRLLEMNWWFAGLCYITGNECALRKDFKPIVPRLKGLSIELTSRKVNSLEQPPTHVGTELYSQQGVPRRFWLLSSRNAIKNCLQDNDTILVFKFLTQFFKISTFLFGKFLYQNWKRNHVQKSTLLLCHRDLKIWIVINKKAAF